MRNLKNTEKQFGVQKEILKVRTKKEYLALRKLSQLSKNMYNVGLYSVRQHFFETKKYFPYKENYHACKSNENYKLMGSAAAQQTLKKVEENFKSFFGVLKVKGQGARIPRYLEKDAHFELSYPQFKLQKDGTFYIPVSPAFIENTERLMFIFHQIWTPQKLLKYASFLNITHIILKLSMSIKNK